MNGYLQKFAEFANSVQICEKLVLSDHLYYSFFRRFALFLLLNCSLQNDEKLVLSVK